MPPRRSRHYLARLRSHPRLSDQKRGSRMTARITFVTDLSANTLEPRLIMYGKRPAKGALGFRRFFFLGAVIFLVAGCASQPASRILHGNLIARGTPIAIDADLENDDQRILLDRRLHLYGFVPAPNGNSPYVLWVLLESDIFGNGMCTIELLKNGVPLVSAERSAPAGPAFAFVDTLRVFEKTLYDESTSNGLGSTKSL